MKRPAKSRSNTRAFLLLEATLTAVVIAVGLVFISRSLSNSLKALARIQQVDRLLRLAESALSDLEAEVQQFGTLPSDAGTFEPPDERYRWQIASESVQHPLGDLPTEVFRAVTLTVSPVDRAVPTVRVHTIWPASWLAE